MLPPRHRDGSRYKMESCMVEAVIHLAPSAVEGNGKLTPPGMRPRRSPPVWRRPRVLLASFAFLLIGAIVLVKLATPTAPPAAPTPASAALIAHGQIVPARQARV